MSLFKMVATVVVIFHLCQTANAVQVTCPAPPGNLQCGNPEFTSCGVAVDTVQRHFCIHVPATTPSPPAGMPVVIGYHGGTGTARDTIAWLDHLTEQGIILVAPTALETARALGGCRRGWRSMSGDIKDWPDYAVTEINGCGERNDNDLALTQKLLDQLGARYESSNFYAVGFSSGGGFVYQLLITKPLVERFAGFGVMGMAMNELKMVAQQGGTSGVWSANSAVGDDPQIRRPVMVVRGTDEKINFPARQVGEAVDAAFSANICTSSTPPAPSDVVSCFLSIEIAPGIGKNNLPLTLWETRDWLVEFNNAIRQGVEASYPDKGSGVGSVAQQDDTIVVREDYAGTPNGEPVAYVTVVGGQHNVPGAGGAYGPCQNRNCDIRAVDEIVDFWRAHAGFENLWR